MSIEVHNLTVSYYGKSVLEDISLQTVDGEILAVLGPSGSGKTTLLLAIAGLLPYGAMMKGKVLAQGQDITRVPPENRNIPMMFQNYALFPDKTVQRNVSFGLRMQHRYSKKIKQKTSEILKLLHIQDKASRYPHELSGGEQQRVALGRLLVLEPNIMLLDEPIGALDRHLRERVLSEIKSLQEQIGFTMLYVTHDQNEALFLADRIAVLRNGRLQQVGNSKDIYSRPTNLFVAQFMGQTNLIHARVSYLTENKAVFRNAADVIFETSVFPDKIQNNAFCHLLLRPESIQISQCGQGYPATVEGIVFTGGIRHYRLRVDGVEEPLLASWTNQLNVKKGDKVEVSWSKDSLVAIEEE